MVVFPPRVPIAWVQAIASPPFDRRQAFHLHVKVVHRQVLTDWPIPVLSIRRVVKDPSSGPASTGYETALKTLRHGAPSADQNLRRGKKFLQLLETISEQERHYVFVSLSFARKRTRLTFRDGFSKDLLARMISGKACMKIRHPFCPSSKIRGMTQGKGQESA